MAGYYVNKNAQANGDHEIHEERYSIMSESENQKYLGEFESCYEAVKEARKYYDQVNGCYITID